MFLSRFALTLLAFATYALGFLLLHAHPQFDRTAGSLSLLPVLVAAWFFGARGGILTGLLAFPLNTLLSNLAGDAGYDILLREGGVPGSLMLILAGGIVGWLSEARQALRRQIAGREQAEQALQRQFENLRSLYQITATLGQTTVVEEVYEAALDSLQGALTADRTAILLFDSDGVVRFKAWRGLSETYRKAAEGHSPWPPNAQDPQPVLVPDAQEEPTLASLRRVFSDEGLGALAFIPLTRQGRLLGKFMIYYNTPHAFNAEEIQLAQTIARHVAFAIARAGAESRLRLLAAALDSAANAVVITDREGAIQYVNPAFTALTGYAPEEALGQTPRLLKSGAQDQAFYKRLWDTILAGQVWRAEIVNRRKDGRPFTVEQVITPVCDERGEITRFVAIELDVTERKQRERELEAIATVSAALRAAQTLDDMLPRLLDETLSIVGTDSGALWLYNPAHAELHQAVARGWFTQLSEAPMKPGEGVAGSVFAAGKAHLSHEFARDPLARESTLPQIPSGWGGACLPIRSTTEVVGVLFVAVHLPRELTPPETHLLTALAEIAGNSVHRARLLDETRRRAERMAALYEIDRAISGSTDLRATLNVFLEQTTVRLSVDAAEVLLYNPVLLTLDYAAGRGFRTAALQHTHLRLGEGLASRAVLERQTVHVADLRRQRTGFLRSPSLAAEGFVAYYGIPLVAKGQVIGVLELFHRALLPADAEWLSFMETLAEQAAIAVDNARLFTNLQRANIEIMLAYDATIEGWSRALELRDEETEGHTLRATELTVRLGRATGIGEDQLVHIRRGALLHDIGKIGVPDGILLKPGPLTDEEWEIMRNHPIYAHGLLHNIAYLRPALDIPYCHHEKWDGTGYPRGLKGDEIPLAARLFAVADVWDALTSDRPYRKAWPEEKAREYIRSEAGKHFDPQVAELFLKMIETSWV